MRRIHRVDLSLPVSQLEAQNLELQRMVVMVAAIHFSFVCTAPVKRLRNGHEHEQPCRQPTSRLPDVRFDAVRARAVLLAQTEKKRGENDASKTEKKPSSNITWNFNNIAVRGVLGGLTEPGSAPGTKTGETNK